MGYPGESRGLPGKSKSESESKSESKGESKGLRVKGLREGERMKQEKREGATSLYPLENG